MYAPPAEIKTEVFARMPDRLRKSGTYSPWLEVHSRLGFHSFLEGPSFDRDGNLYCTDIAFGRIFRISPKGEWDVVIEYDGEPNGLKLHHDGSIYLADHKRGLLRLDAKTGKLETLLGRVRGEPFKGLNDLIFGAGGELYFTDQGQTGLHDPTGRLYRYDTDGKLDALLNRIPSPNGLVLSADASQLLLAVTRANAVWRLFFMHDRKPTKVGVFVQMSGGVGPDGMALDAAGNLAVCHFSMGSVWLFSPLGEPLYRVRSCAGMFTTNCAYGGEQNKYLYITESETGSILRAQMPQPGALLYSQV